MSEKKIVLVSLGLLREICVLFHWDYSKTGINTSFHWDYFEAVSSFHWDYFEEGMLIAWEQLTGIAKGGHS